MMPETSQIAIRRQIVKEAASEALEALFTTYWTTSFDSTLLQERLADPIFLTRDAQALEGPYPNSELLSRGDNTIAPSQVSLRTGA